MRNEHFRQIGFVAAVHQALLGKQQRQGAPTRRRPRGGGEAAGFAVAVPQRAEKPCG